MSRGFELTWPYLWLGAGVLLVAAGVCMLFGVGPALTVLGVGLIALFYAPAGF